jgi:saccharopine dehydrogenase-like NADP-dependent oxidoreductase
MSHSYVVFGAGRMGRAVVHHLVNEQSTKLIKICDYDSEASKNLYDRYASTGKVEFVAGSTRFNEHVMSQSFLDNLLKGSQVCIATAGYKTYVELTKACINAGVGMVDLGGNRDVVDGQKLLHDSAVKNNVTIIPDCGLAPGLIGILGMHAFQTLDRDGCTSIDVHMRVGGLPKNPGSIEENPLQYELTWSAEGLINEYEIPSDELKDGVLIKSQALSNNELIQINTPWGQNEFEAFVTGGGSSNLPIVLAGKARNVDYKTIRYRGHCNIIRALRRLGLFSESYRQTLIDAFDKNMSSKNDDDVVIARAGARGTFEGKIKTILFQILCQKNVTNGLSAMAQTTGFSASIVANMIADGSIKKKGVVDGEVAVPGHSFIERLKKSGITISGISK